MCGILNSGGRWKRDNLAGEDAQSSHVPPPPSSRKAPAYQGKPPGMAGPAQSTPGTTRSMWLARREATQSRRAPTPGSTNPDAPPAFKSAAVCTTRTEAPTVSNALVTLRRLQMPVSMTATGGLSELTPHSYPPPAPSPKQIHTPPGPPRHPFCEPVPHFFEPVPASKPSLSPSNRCLAPFPPRSRELGACPLRKSSPPIPVFGAWHLCQRSRAPHWLGAWLLFNRCLAPY